MDKVRSLFFAANPLETGRLSLDIEIREITSKIRSSEYRDSIELVSIWAVRPDDLLQSLNTYRPRIVHFSGHGSPSGEIILVDRQGTAKPVSAEALKALFTTLKDNIQLVILNACFSKIQAEAIVQVIDCAVGMPGEIDDDSAIAFISSLYRAIGFGRSVEDAFEQGKLALILEDLAPNHLPVLLTKPGLDPSKIVLVNPLLPISKDNDATPRIPSKHENAQERTFDEIEEIRVDVVVADITSFSADVLSLKYTMRLYGADRAVSQALGITNAELARTIPDLGSSRLLYSKGAIASGCVLFTNVGDLYHFKYDEIRCFASDTLEVLSRITPTVRHIAMTIHGVGYGLDETEVLRVQLAGFVDAIMMGSYPVHLERISIVERDPQRASLLSKTLVDLLPDNVIHTKQEGLNTGANRVC